MGDPMWAKGSATYQPIDTLVQAADLRSRLPESEAPKDLTLGTLADYFGIPHEDAHDALGDVRVNVQVARTLREALKGT